MNVELSIIEKIFAYRIAKKRAKKKAKDKRYSNMSGDRVHYIGLLGEFAFWKATNIPAEIDVKETGDGGIDFEHKGKTIQLKTRDTSERSLPDLMVEDDELIADYYVLAELDATQHKTIVKLVGWYPRDRFDNKTKNRYGERWIARRQQLYGMESLLSYLGVYE